MDYRRFLFFDMIGAVLWATQAALLGYFAGKAFADQLWVAFVVAFAVTGIVGGFITIKERRRVRQENAAAAAERDRGESVPAPGPRSENSPTRGRAVSFLLETHPTLGVFIRF